MLVTTSEVARPSLSAQGIACGRGGRPLLTDLNLSLQPGEILWVKGGNGRGKSSLLRILASVVPPDEGRVDWASRPVYLGHANALKEDLSAFESLAFMAGLHGLAVTADAIEQALKRFGMYARRRAMVRTFSQGQRRRVALARLLLNPLPGPWVLDEPFDALDKAGIEVLNEVIENHVRQGGSVVMTSHVDLSFKSCVHRAFLLPDPTQTVKQL
ncbi:MAG: heme ABC exporter ATP-binding protein CcmA [Leptothrix ochracea]|uniref:heme ABC exporter ATP-binding protein CcmA n=2 Tax=Leptothrix ochracea TaxID=735331 RepID=UPI0034E202C5